MVIGVKYCGGCNSVYDRGRQVNRLKEQFPEHEFCTASQTKVCDVWLAVCGAAYPSEIWKRKSACLS